ncbi:MAG: NAD(P)-binding domain-containing protein [Bacteroidota bacterium]
MKKIGILGSGIVAKTLGEGFIQNGYSVMLGTRDVSKLADWQAEQGGEAQTGSFDEAAAFGDIIVLAVKGTVASRVLNQINPAHLAGKTIMDTTNPISDSAPEKGVLHFFTDQNGSLMETLQKEHPKAHFVKGFSSVGSARMINPSFESTPSMFICGNDENAKKDVASIVEMFGWEVEDMGGAEAARAIEPLCMLWCIPGFLNNQWSHAYKLLK